MPTRWQRSARRHLTLCTLDMYCIAPTHPLIPAISYPPSPLSSPSRRLLCTYRSKAATVAPSGDAPRVRNENLEARDRSALFAASQTMLRPKFSALGYVGGQSVISADMPAVLFDPLAYAPYFAGGSPLVGTTAGATGSARTVARAAAPSARSPRVETGEYPIIVAPPVSAPVADPSGGADVPGKQRRQAAPALK